MNKKIHIFRKIGKVFVNFGNLTFASIVLGTIIKGDYERLTMLWVGGSIVLVLITIGIVMLTIGDETWD